jgi:WXG100 family type VII secretion target
VTAFVADLDALGDLVARLRAFDRRAEQLAVDLDGVASRLGEMWSGTAADEHATAHRRWMAAHGRIRSAADQLARVVDTARTDYAAAANANARMWA